MEKYIKYSFDDHFTKLIPKIKKNFGFPVVIKPINEGSSVNVYICNKSNLKNKLKKLKPYKEILIEEFISGREIQAAILGNKKLGAIELKPKRKFYDFIPGILFCTMFLSQSPTDRRFYVSVLSGGRLY